MRSFSPPPPLNSQKSEQGVSLGTVDFRPWQQGGLAIPNLNSPTSSQSPPTPPQKNPRFLIWLEKEIMDFFSKLWKTEVE